MIYLALGSNLAGDYRDSHALLDAVPAVLAARSVTVVACSQRYRSVAVGGPPNQADYINAVLAVRCVCSANGLLRRLHATEADFGRKRQIRWASRSLDIDILDWHGQCSTHRSMHHVQLPHPYLASRAFVLLPLREIAPGWRHPRTNLPIAQLLTRLPAQARHALNSCVDRGDRI